VIENHIMYLLRWAAIGLAASAVLTIGAAVYVICYALGGHDDAPRIGNVVADRQRFGRR